MNALIDNGVEIYKGATFIRVYTWLENGTAVDLTGATLGCKFVKEDYSAVVFTATVTATDPVNGVLEVKIPAATTGAATPVVNPSGFRFLSEAFEPLPFDVTVDRGNGPETIVRGTARFYNSSITV